MSAIDIVLVVIALVAVGVAVACALQLKGLRAELRERGDNGAEMLAALEQANNVLDTLNVALAETRRTANAIAQQQTTDAAVEQQRYLTIAREFSQAGDRMDDLRRETAQQLGVNAYGIYVADVVKGGPADKAGLKVGDRIVSIDGTEVAQKTDLGTIIQQHSAGDTLSITVARGGQMQTVSLTLGEKNNSTTAAAAQQQEQQDAESAQEQPQG